MVLQCNLFNIGLEIIGWAGLSKSLWNDHKNN